MRMQTNSFLVYNNNKTNRQYLYIKYDAMLHRVKKIIREIYMNFYIIINLLPLYEIIIIIIII